MNATPLDSILKKQQSSSKHVIMIAGFAIAVLVLVGIGGFFLTQQVEKPQTTATKASIPLPSCIIDTIPLDAEPLCYNCLSGDHKGELADAPSVDGRCPVGSTRVGSGTGRDTTCSWCPADAPTRLSGRNDNWNGDCRRPREGLCKSKGSLCAECVTSDEYRQVCMCGDTPTPPQKTPPVNCPVPNVVTNVTISCPSCAQ